jgi:tetratricopeptide (TPR) repeat protein
LAYERQENFQKAIENYKEEIKRRPKEATVSYSNCALSLAILGRRDEAIALCKQGEALEKKDWRVSDRLGFLLHMDGNLEGAEEAYRRALKIDAKQSSIYVDLARLLEDRGKGEEAFALAKEASEKLPKSPEALNRYGYELMQRKQYADAEEKFCKAIELAEIDGLFRRNLIQLLFEMGREDEADDEISKYEVACANYDLSLNGLAQMLIFKKEGAISRPKKALQIAKKALELNPNSIESTLTVGGAHYRVGNWDAAIKEIERSIQLYKAQGAESATAFQLFFLAMAKWQNDEKEEARKLFGEGEKWLESNHVNHEDLDLIRAEAEALIEQGGD